MKQGVAKVKERYNWPVTILLITGLITVIFPLYMTVVYCAEETFGNDE